MGPTTLQSGSYNMSALSKITSPQPQGTKRSPDPVNDKIKKARMKLREFQRSKRKLNVMPSNNASERLDRAADTISLKGQSGKVS